MHPVTDIVIRSYRGDFGWLAYALRSLHAKSSGFGQIHVVVPQGDKHLLADLTAEKLYGCPAYSDDYLGQQITKLLADTYSGADYIMHWDSDTVLMAPLTPSDLIVDGKPIIYYEPYESVGREPWQPIVTEILGWSPEHEFMRRHPFVYPRWLYAEVRAFLEERYGQSLENYIVSRPYRSFTEFNVLGAYAWARHRNKFTWRNPHGDPVYVRQFRSWDGLDSHREEVESLV
jgi:hypothetical protein